MTRARDIADLVDANGDIVAGALDNVPAADLVNDTTPQLGGALDAQSNNITSVGQLAIGTATPTSASGGKILAIETTADEHTNLVFNTANTGRNGIIEGRRTGRSGSERFAQINIQNNSDDGEIRFYTAPSGSSVSERMIIDASGRVTMPYQPMASAQNAGTSSVATQVLDNFSTVRNNIGNHFNNSTGTFLCPVGGRYEINYNIQSNYAAAYHWLAIFYNSAVYDSLHWNPGTAAGHWQCSLSSIIHCAANDTLAVGVQNVNNNSTALISDSFVSFKLLG